MAPTKTAEVENYTTSSDSLKEDSDLLKGSLSPEDQEKLEQYVTNVENELVAEAEPAEASKPQEQKPPEPEIKPEHFDLDLEKDGSLPPASTSVQLGSAALAPIPGPPKKPLQAIFKPRHHQADRKPVAVEETATEEVQVPVVSKPVEQAKAKPEAAKTPEKRGRDHHQPQHADTLHSDILALTRELKYARDGEDKKDEKPTKVADTPKPETKPEAVQPVVDPVETLVEVAGPQPGKDPNQTRKDFVKQQEELWGKNDKIAPEDVPEGELTMEQYMALRPGPEEGDMLHLKDKNGRAIVYDATTGHRVKEADYVRQDASRKVASDHYYEFQQKDTRDKVHEVALKNNEVNDSNNAEIVRIDFEGEQLIDKDPRLKGLLTIGEELLELHKKKVSPEDFETNIKPKLEDKKALYDFIYSKLEDEGVDQRALDFINNKTASFVENPEHTRVEGSAYLDGAKIKILDLLESPDGKQKAYTIEEEDGSIRAVFADEVEFKRDYAQPEQKLSSVEKLREFFKNENELRKRSGKSYYYGVFGRVGNWLRNHGVDEDSMSFEQINEQRRKNRISNLLGATAVVVGSIVAMKVGGADPFGLGGAETAAAALTPDLVSTEVVSAPIIADRVADQEATQNLIDELNSGLEQPVDVVETAAPSIDINNPDYNLASGAKGYEVFENLGLSADVWDANAGTMAEQFKNDFYIENGDVRFKHSGWLSPEARQFIENLRVNR